GQPAVARRTAFTPPRSPPPCVPGPPPLSVGTPVRRPTRSGFHCTPRLPAYPGRPSASRAAARPRPPTLWIHVAWAPAPPAEAQCRLATAAQPRAAGRRSVPPGLTHRRLMPRVAGRGPVLLGLCGAAPRRQPRIRAVWTPALRCLIRPQHPTTSSYGRHLPVRLSLAATAGEAHGRKSAAGGARGGRSTFGGAHEAVAKGAPRIPAADKHACRRRPVLPSSNLAHMAKNPWLFVFIVTRTLDRLRIATSAAVARSPVPMCTAPKTSLPTGI
ncbi:hypothetical protein U9M48_013302, partial [Paspalum notatum var. saurae]